MYDALENDILFKQYCPPITTKQMHVPIYE